MDAVLGMPRSVIARPLHNASVRASRLDRMGPHRHVRLSTVVAVDETGFRATVRKYLASCATTARAVRRASGTAPWPAAHLGWRVKGSSSQRSSASGASTC